MSLINSPDGRMLLLAHLVRCPRVIEKASTVLRPEDLYYEDERGLQLAWAVSKDWFQAHKQPIAAPYMVAELEKRVAGDPTYIDTDKLVELLQSLSTIYRLPADLLQPDYILTSVQELVDARRVMPALSTAAEGMDALDKRLAELNKVMDATRIAYGAVADLFSEAALNCSFPTKDPFGVPFADALLDGGTAVGEVYGLLGVSGMGKSILSMQLALEKARRKKHVALLHYEMMVHPTVARRIYGYVADIPRDVLRAHPNLLAMPQQYIDALRKAQSEYASEYLHVIDMKSSKSAGAGGIADIRAQLRELDSKGKHVDLVVIDQLLPMVTRIMGVGNMKNDSAVRRMLMQRVVDEALVLARPEDMACSVLLVHQSSSDVKKRPAVVRPKQGESLEDRGFDNWVSYCLALGTQDEEQRCWCVTTKSREAPRDGFIVQLNQRFPRFDYEPNRFVADKAGFVTNMTSSPVAQVAQVYSDGHDSGVTIEE